MSSLRIGVIGLRGVPCDYSGMERGAEQYYSVLADRGHEIVVYCRKKYTGTTEHKHKGIRLVRTPYIPSKATETASHAMISTVHAATLRDFDVVHYHALGPNLAAPVLKFLDGTALISFVRGLDWKRRKWRGVGGSVLRWAEGLMVRFADEVAVVSKALQGYYAREYGIQTHYVPNGVVNTAGWKLDPDVLQRFDLTSGEYVIFMARLVPEKRVEDLISAFKELDTEVKLAVVGGGRFSEAYVDRLKKLAGGDSRIVFTGHLSGTALYTVLANATLFVSTSELEGLPNAPLESMECGVLPLLSNIPPHRELLEPVAGEDLFFPPGDIEELRGKLKEILENRHEYTEVAARAQKFVRKHYTWESVADRIEDLSRSAVCSS